MTDQLLMPKLGLTMTEGVLMEWKIAPGDRFARGDVVFVVETDKAATDIEAEVDGQMKERLVDEGETVPVGAPVALLESGAAAARSGADEPPASSAAIGVAAPPPAARHDPQRKAKSGHIAATPLARRLARKDGIDLASISGSGPRGRIKAIDVEQAITEISRAASEAPSAPARTSAAGSSVTRSRPTPTQATMARRLSAVKQGVPHFYLSTEAEVSSLLDLRAELNGDASFAKLTLTHFLLAAVGRALVAFPNMNRVWDEGEIVSFGATSVSMAVETANGLYVPVVRDCGSASLDQIGAAARAMTERAREGRLSGEDMNGAAIAVSNAGMHDVTWMASIINPGQSAILGVGSVREIFRPDTEGRPALRRELGLVLSGDHRVHTGVEGLAFLNHVKSSLETPKRLLRQI